MTLMVCSGWHPAGRITYGDNFLATFNRWAAPDIRLGVWVEEAHDMPRDACRILWDIPGARDFHKRHRNNLAAQGRVPAPCWKASEIRSGYSFRTDAYKFWKQILIPGRAAQELADGDVLVWFDGDVTFHRKFDAALIERLLDGADVAYLGRGSQHSEIGFYALRLNAVTRSFLVAIADAYTSDDVFKLPEWHSAYVWDHVRRGMGMSERNLCHDGARSHVWPLTKLAYFSEHRKGPRKGMAR